MKLINKSVKKTIHNYKTTLKQINLYLDKASQIAGIIGMIFLQYCLLFVDHSFWHFSFMYLNVILIDSMQGLYNWIYGLE